MDGLLHLYRERSGNPEFWAEPINALTNASFVLAAFAAWNLARSREVLTESSWLLIVLSAAIGVGSFLFHTCATASTMWLDIIPIALFQVAFLWLAGRWILHWPGWLSASLVVAVVGLSFAAMPFYKPINGSLFYLPALLAISGYGLATYFKGGREPLLLLTAAGIFAVAVSARSVDWIVPWPMGTHSLWHLLNGLVLYLAMRTWIIHLAVAKPAALFRQ